MMYRNHILFKEPNVSLLIRKLNRDDEGDYQLNLNIEFHNKTGLVIKEERNVHVTVDGEFFPIMTSWMTMFDAIFTGFSPKFTNICCFCHSPCVHSSHWEEPVLCSCRGQGKRDLDLFCRERNKSCVPVAEGQHRTRSQWQIPLFPRQLYIVNQSCEKRGQGNLQLCGQQPCQPGSAQQDRGTQCLL